MFGGFFQDLSDDPIFGNHMRQMNRMMDPLNMMHFGPSPMSIMGPGMSMQPFGFPNFPSIMDSFKQAGDAGNSYSFQSCQVTTMRSGPDGKPQIYQESSSTRTAPGGVKETKKSVCDSKSGTKRLAIGRHIGERGHVRERVQDMRSGEREETEDFINIEEDEAETFNREWTRKARDVSSAQRLDQDYLSYGGPRAIMHSSHSTTTPTTRSRYRPTSYSSRPYIPHMGSTPALSYSRSHSVPIIEEVDDDAAERITAKQSRKRQRERQVPEITEVTDAAEDRTVPRKIQQRSNKFQPKKDHQ